MGMFQVGYRWVSEMVVSTKDMCIHNLYECVCETAWKEHRHSSHLWQIGNDDLQMMTEMY